MGDDRYGSDNGDRTDHPRRDSWGGDAYRETYDEILEELERQARETMRVFRESAGDLGARVRDIMDKASGYWEETGSETPPPSLVSPEDEARARALARRWVDIDFLVDPELANAMHITGFTSGSVWRVELRERGESRRLSDGREPYTGAQPPAPGPVLPVWDYTFPISPDIESGERRERVASTEMLGACLRCNGTGHRACKQCEGKGFVQCPVCHGRAKTPCTRCRGRGRIADPTAERRARASKSYFQVQAERLAENAAGRLADFSERLRQEYGVPLPPSAQWAPIAPASGETIPCPDCVNGSVPCDCGNGKRVCPTCHGTSADTCATCNGTGRVIQYREIIRRFDTRISERTLREEGAESSRRVSDEMLRKSKGEPVWDGPADALDVQAPAVIPADVWADALSFAQGEGRAMQTAGVAADGVDSGERRVTSRRLYVLRMPYTHVEYSVSEQPFSFTAVGATGSERFWAQSFPPRWNRVGRFFKALTRDLMQDQSSQHFGSRDISGVRDINEFRSRREHARVQRVRIEPAEPEEARRDGEPGTTGTATPPDSGAE